MEAVGAIVENPEFYPYLTGWENLKHFANMHKKIADERLDEVVERVGLTSAIHDKVKTYSPACASVLVLHRRFFTGQSFLF